MASLTIYKNIGCPKPQSCINWWQRAATEKGLNHLRTLCQQSLKIAKASWFVCSPTVKSQTRTKLKTYPIHLCTSMTSNKAGNSPRRQVLQSSYIKQLFLIRKIAWFICIAINFCQSSNLIRQMSLSWAMGSSSISSHISSNVRTKKRSGQPSMIVRSISSNCASKEKTNAKSLLIKVSTTRSKNCRMSR